jgi:hypothetical protein
MSECSGRTGKYVPWSWGEIFSCDTCGERVRMSHTVQPIDGPADYDSTYPIPAHDAPVEVSR